MKAKLYLIITVDTEDSERPGVVNKTEMETMIYGRVDGRYYGFPKIMDMCKKFDCKATFFASVFDHSKYGKEAIKEVCQEIRQQGHDVQLHTHPANVYDKEKVEMHRYPLESQIQIIREGKQLLQEWTDEYPVAHRAGAYSADENTLTALKMNNIPIDTSNFYGHKNCKVSFTRNRVVEKDGIIEVPVTIFRRVNSAKLGVIKVEGRGSFIKTDIDWATLDELLSFVEQAKTNNVRVMTLFLHSYSFLKFDSSFSHFEPDYQDMEKFEKFLSVITKDPEIEVVTMKQFYDLYCRDPGIFTSGSDFVPVMKRQIGMAEALRKRLGLIKSRVMAQS